MLQVLEESRDAQYAEMTVRQFFARHTYSQAFQQRYFMPMCAAVWSMPNAQVGPLCHCVPALHLLDSIHVLHRPAHCLQP